MIEGLKEVRCWLNEINMKEQGGAGKSVVYGLGG